MVSVPLRGKGRDQLGKSLRMEVLAWGFPSPCGEKVGINNRSCLRFRGWITKFPSPCGEKVGINTRDIANILTAFRCFRPLAGKR